MALHHQSTTAQPAWPMQRRPTAPPKADGEVKGRPTLTQGLSPVPSSTNLEGGNWGGRQLEALETHTPHQSWQELAGTAIVLSTVAAAYSGGPWGAAPGGIAKGGREKGDEGSGAVQ
uniref:Uncharacterized protein n=1 Tax=Arundo donax TaxID=35708 RepID=A0A0A9D1N3_ARUDO